MSGHKHETKICPCCAREFVCKVNRIHQCDCMNVRLSPETVEHIRQFYDNCLCVACLQALERLVRSQLDISRRRL